MKEKISLIPRWLYYTCLVTFLLGITQMMTGGLVWGVTPEKNGAIGLTIGCGVVVLADRILKVKEIDF